MELNVPNLVDVRTMGNVIQQQEFASAYLVGKEKIAAFVSISH